MSNKKEFYKCEICFLMPNYSFNEYLTKELYDDLAREFHNEVKNIFNKNKNHFYSLWRTQINNEKWYNYNEKIAFSIIKENCYIFFTNLEFEKRIDDILIEKKKK